MLEPEIIAGLSESFIKICSANRVRYSASIITNGYLADGGTAVLLKRCGVSFAQVTVGGKPEVHNKRRILRASPGEGTYRKIIEVVNHLTSSGLSVVVRMNIDRDNLREAESNIAILTGLIRDKASYCTATLPGSFVIDPEGYVYKCWNDIGEKHYSIGMIQSLHDDIASEWEQYNQMNYDSCRECELLPVCAGGCPRDVVHFGKSPECEPCRYILGELLAF